MQSRGVGGSPCPQPREGVGSGPCGLPDRHAQVHLDAAIACQLDALDLVGKGPSLEALPNDAGEGRVAAVVHPVNNVSGTAFKPATRLMVFSMRSKGSNYTSNEWTALVERASR